MPNHTFILNGKRVNVDCADDVRMLWVIRDLLGVTGPKYGCGLDVCKACTCHINRAAAPPQYGVEAFNPCSVTIAEIGPNDEITTIEGLAATANAPLHPVQQAWIDHDVAQCGYCQPGQIMAATALIAEKKGQGLPMDDAALDELRNICRCGTYARIRDAIKAAAAGMP